MSNWRIRDKIALPVTGSLTCSASIRWEIQAPLAFVPPVFGNLLRRLVQPFLVGSQPNHFDRRKPLGRIAPVRWERPARSAFVSALRRINDATFNLQFPWPRRISLFETGIHLSKDN